MTSLQISAFVSLWMIVGCLFLFVLLLYRVVDKAYRNEGADHHTSTLPPGTTAPDVEIHTAAGLENFSFPDEGTLHVLVFVNATCAGCIQLLSELDANDPPEHQLTAFIIGEGMLEYAEPGSASFGAHWVGHPADIQRDYNLSVVPTSYVLEGRTVLAAASVTTAKEMDDLVMEAVQNRGPLTTAG